MQTSHNSHSETTLGCPKASQETTLCDVSRQCQVVLKENVRQHQALSPKGFCKVTLRAALRQL